MKFKRRFWLDVSLFLLMNSNAAWSDRQVDQTEERLRTDLFVSIPPIVLPAIQNRKIKGIYKIEFTLELEKAEDSERVHSLKKKIIDAVLTDTYGLLNVVWEPELRFDIKDIKERLKKIITQVTGPNVIKDVLIQELQRHTQKGV